MRVGTVLLPLQRSVEVESECHGRRAGQAGRPGPRYVKALQGNSTSPAKTARYTEKRKTGGREEGEEGEIEGGRNHAFSGKTENGH